MIKRFIYLFKDNYRILLSSLINFIVKNITVYILIDVQEYNAETSYIYILIFTLIFSFFSNLKIGFGLQMRLPYLLKWLLIMVTLLLFENFVFVFFESLFDVKVFLSSILSLCFYVIRFLFQKKYIFK